MENGIKTKKAQKNVIFKICISHKLSKDVLFVVTHENVVSKTLICYKKFLVIKF